MNLIRKILLDESVIKTDNPNILNVTMGKSMSLIDYAQLVIEKHKEIYEQIAEIKFDKKLIDKVPYSAIENKKLKNFFPNYKNFQIEQNINEILRFFKN